MLRHYGEAVGREPGVVRCHRTGRLNRISMIAKEVKYPIGCRKAGAGRRVAAMSLCHRLFLKAAERSGGEGVCSGGSSKHPMAKNQRNTKTQAPRPSPKVRSLRLYTLNY